MSEIIALKTLIEGLKKTIHDKTNELILLRADEKRERIIYEYIKRKKPEASDELLKDIERKINKLKDEIVEVKNDLEIKLNDLNKLLNPETAIELFQNKIPILLFPVKIETKYIELDADKPKLLVRIFPDNIAVDAFEKQLTEKEVEDLKKYWDIVNQNIEDDKKQIAWKQLVDKFGVHRSAYLISLGENFDHSDLKPEGWSSPPKSYIMPDYFQIRLYRKLKSGDKETTTLYKEQTGNLIPNPLIVGPDPLLTDNIDDNNFDETAFGKDAKWIFNFPEAETKGMALTIELTGLTKAEINEGFCRVIAVGMKILPNPNPELNPETESPTDFEKNISTLKELINHHHFTDGFSFLKQGTPTNNTNENKSEYNTSETNYIESYNLEIEEQKIADGYESKNGFHLGKVLGMKNEAIKDLFNHIENADLTENQDAKCMAEVVWYALLLPYLNMYPKLLSDTNKEYIRNYFIEYVRSRGFIPAIRTGNSPYGILPISSLNLWNSGDNAVELSYSSLLSKLFPYWQEMAADPEKVPRTGASNDPEKELIRILGMEPVSNEIRIRSILSNNYIINLFKFTWGSIFSKNKLIRWFSSLLYSSKLNKLYTYSFDKWKKEFENSINFSKELMNKILNNTGSELLNLTPWGGSYNLGIPIVQEEELSETKPLANHYKNNNQEDINYISFLKTKTIDEIKNIENPFNSLLFILICKAIKNKGSNWTESDIENPLNHLALLPSANLDRLVRETLDTCSHRLDAWINSLYSKRLKENSDRFDGIYLGAYGWIENLTPKQHKKSGGYIHAPSIAHGVTAAVLRNAYLTHSDKDNNERMTVNLTSERTRKALWLLEGIRQGQSLNVLLGYRFERNLHEIHRNNGTELYLDQYIYPFRKLFPLNVQTQTDNSQTSETIAPNNVVDGLALLDAYKSGNIGYNKDETLKKINSQVKKAIEMELDDVAETFDAIADLALSESVYQAIQGNYLRSGAALNVTSADSTPPDEFSVCKSPHGGINIKHHLLLLFNSEIDNLVNSWPRSLRSELNPVLNNWAADLFGDPTSIFYSVEYFDNTNFVIQKSEINLSDVVFFQEENINYGLAPIDYIYLSNSSMRDGTSELEEKLIFNAKKKLNLGKNIEITRLIIDDVSTQDGKKDMGSILKIAKALYKVVAGSEFSKVQDFMLPEETEGEFKDEQGNKIDFFTIYNYENIKKIFIDEENNQLKEKKLTRLKYGLIDCCDNIKANILSNLNPDLNSEKNKNYLSSLVVILEKLFLLDIKGCFPVETNFNSVESVKEIVNQAESESLKKSIENKINEIEPIIEEIGFIENKYRVCDSVDIKKDLFTELLKRIEKISKIISGKSFIILPEFKTQNYSELTGLQVDLSEIKLWFQKLSFTHPAIKKIEDLSFYINANNGNLNFSICQLPKKDNDKWIALNFEGLSLEEKVKLQGTLSLAIVSPDNIDFTNPVSGIVLEKWDEIIPGEKEITSLVYQYDAPGNEAPQACLLCISPDPNTEENIKWKWDYIVNALEETMELYKIRAVDTDALKYFGRFLPAMFLQSEYINQNQILHLAIPKKTIKNA